MLYSYKIGIIKQFSNDYSIQNIEKSMKTTEELKKLKFVSHTSPWDTMRSPWEELMDKDFTLHHYYDY